MKWGPLTFQEHAEEAAPRGERDGKVTEAQEDGGGGIMTLRDLGVNLVSVEAGDPGDMKF